jgi:hypothetical protein
MRLIGLAVVLILGLALAPLNGGAQQSGKRTTLAGSRTAGRREPNELRRSSCTS